LIQLFVGVVLLGGKMESLLLDDVFPGARWFIANPKGEFVDFFLYFPARHNCG
jgi:hypothetical protein